jgi:hypothetical protein
MKATATCQNVTNNTSTYHAYTGPTWRYSLVEFMFMILTHNFGSQIKTLAQLPRRILPCIRNWKGLIVTLIVTLTVTLIVTH